MKYRVFRFRCISTHLKANAKTLHPIHVVDWPMQFFVSFFFVAETSASATHQLHQRSVLFEMNYVFSRHANDND